MFCFCFEQLRTQTFFVVKEFFGIALDDHDPYSEEKLHILEKKKNVALIILQKPNTLPTLFSLRFSSR